MAGSSSTVGWLITHRTLPAHPNKKVNVSVVVADLIAGIREFKENVVPEKQELFDELATGQSPATLFITCADSRIDPSLITQADPGDIFVVRNAGNIVPRLDADGSSPDGNAGSIEYAISALNVSHVVVCGHSSCGAMGGLQDLDGIAAALPSVRRWLEHSESLLDTPAADDLDALIEANVLLQLEHLATYPGVQAKLDAGDITLHGWVYDIGSGDVRAHDGDTFTSLLDTSPQGG